MKRLFTILIARRTGNVFVALIILSFIILSLIRLYPYENTLNVILKEVDDWGIYARFGLDIKHNGILLPMINGDYDLPAGFLYNYFIALCFLVFGENIVPIYFIQSILLGFSVAFIYWAFREKMKPLTGIVFLFTLFFFALADVYKNYTFRLLSENLALFTISLFFLCFIKGLEKHKYSLQLWAAVLLGLSISIRPNIFPFGIILIVIMLYYFLKQKKQAFLKLILFAFLLGVSMSLLMIRNRIVSGCWTFFPTSASASIINDLFQNPDFSLSYFGKKILFCFGFLSFLDPVYHLRFHWTIMWAGYFVYLLLRIRMNLKFEIWEIASHLFIISYIGLMILIAPIYMYGFRMLIPVTFIILPFSFMAWDRLRYK